MPINKPKLIFNYQQIYKKFFSIYIELTVYIYNNFLDSFYEIIFLVNLKYIYYYINLHLDNKNIFIFIIQNIRQL